MKHKLMIFKNINPKERFELFTTLQVRQHKLNEEFVFTPEHIEKILWIDQEIKKCVHTLQKEGEKMVKELDLLTKKKNSFFNDYEILAVIDPKILIWKEESQSLCEPDEEDGIIDVIDNYHHETNFRLEFNPHHAEHSCYFSDFNWNILIGAKNNEFANYHIGYGIHELYDHSLWSLQEIVKINAIWCDLKVEYQHYN